MTDDGSSPFPSHGRDDFDAWLHAPVASTSADPRIEVRRVQPFEFERIYDLIDAAFGFKRSRALSDWVYRHNPFGVARCWVSVERATGKLVGTAVNWPWPLAHGMRALPAAQGGDAALLPSWQHQGLHENAGRVRESHPWTRAVVNYGWPNARSLKRVRNTTHKATRLMGTIPRRILPLRAHAYLVNRGLPWPLPSVGGRLADTLFTRWSSMILGGRFEGSIEHVGRFDSDFDAVTRRCMRWDGYWCPHDADFLNWRYVSDPVREHIAFALTMGTTVVGYSVVRLHHRKAHLMELVVPDDQPGAAPALLMHGIRLAKDAGCSDLAVAAAPAWRHWRLLRSAGFVSAPPQHVMYAYSWREDTPGVQTLANWQVLGGDLDPFTT